MRGYAKEQLLDRNLDDVTPLRFNLLVKLIPEVPHSNILVMPDQSKNQKEHTRANQGYVVAMGEMVKFSEGAEGLLDKGSRIIFDESVAIDDPNRCFKFEGDTYMLFDMDTVIGVLSPVRVNGDDSDHNVLLLGDRIMAVRPEKKEQKRASGLYVPLSASPEPVGAVVVWTGMGAFSKSGKRIPMTVKKGDYVLYPQFGGTDFIFDNKTYIILRQDRILAVVEE